MVMGSATFDHGKPVAFRRQPELGVLYIYARPHGNAREEENQHTEHQHAPFPCCGVASGLTIVGIPFALFSSLVLVTRLDTLFDELNHYLDGAGHIKCFNAMV